MNSLEILLAMAFAVFLMPPCEAAWEDEDQETDLGFPDQAGGIEDDLHGTAERSWKQRNRWEDSSEFLAQKMYMYPLNRPLPYSSSRIHSCPSLRSLEALKQKRYMGMEIPEYIMKNDGTGNGNTPQRETKQKLVSSG